MEIINQVTGKKDTALFDYRTNTWVIESEMKPYFSIKENRDTTTLYVYQPDVDVGEFAATGLTLKEHFIQDGIVVFEFDGINLDLVGFLKMLGFDA